MMSRRTFVLAAAALAAGVGVRDASPTARAGTASQVALDADRFVARVGDYVEQYFSAARTVTARELVTLQPLDQGFRPSVIP